MLILQLPQQAWQRLQHQKKTQSQQSPFLSSHHSLLQVIEENLLRRGAQINRELKALELHSYPEPACSLLLSDERQTADGVCIENVWPRQEERAELQAGHSHCRPRTDAACQCVHRLQQTAPPLRIHKDQSAAHTCETQTLLAQGPLQFSC